MGYDLIGSADTFSLTINGWHELLDLVHQFGWERVGTRDPQVDQVVEGDKVRVVKGPKKGWSGTYFSKRFVSGQSGNPKGRPKGAVSKFTGLKHEFVRVYEEHGGIEALVRLLKDDPKTYFGLMRDLFPREMRQTIESHSTHEHIGVSETLALAEAAVAAPNAVPLPKPRTG